MAIANFSKLPKDWENIVGGAYAKGCSDVEVKAMLRMTNGMWDTLYNDITESSFRQIVDFGRVLSKAWWMAKARENLSDKQFNATLWYMVMKNQFGWSDKTTTTVKDSSDLSDDDLNMQIQKGLEKFTKTVVA